MNQNGNCGTRKKSSGMAIMPEHDEVKLMGLFRTANAGITDLFRVVFLHLARFITVIVASGRGGGVS
jgi:hypothetical protein